MLDLLLLLRPRFPRRLCPWEALCWCRHPAPFQNLHQLPAALNAQTWSIFRFKSARVLWIHCARFHEELYSCFFFTQKVLDLKRNRAKSARFFKTNQAKSGQLCLAKRCSILLSRKMLDLYDSNVIDFQVQKCSSCMNPLCSIS